MQTQHILIHDIIHEHGERVQNLKKYYPYFKLTENTFSQYKEGRYECLDMAYILMALLRYFIEENNFNEKNVTYAEYQKFVLMLIERDFDLMPEEGEGEELAAYIFDKIRNDGKPFTYEYFDPADKKRKTVRVKLIDSRMEEEGVVYYITSDAIEFYLDTKEIKEESTINVAQLLLEKLIRSQNFKSGIEVVRRINNEVSRLKSRKNEVLNIMSHDIFEGMKAYEEFVTNGTRWFFEEQKLFAKNKELMERALERARQEGMGAVEEIYQLDIELKRAIQRHSELLAACTDLQIKADQMVQRAKVSRLRSSFDYRLALHKVMQADRGDLLEYLVKPFFALHLQKTFPLASIEEMLSYPPEKSEEKEMVSKADEDTLYIFEDELENARIEENYGRLIRGLMKQLSVKERFSLREWKNELERMHGEAVFRNGDFYSFLVHLCQKKIYHMQEVIKKPETFLEDMIKGVFADTQMGAFSSMSFGIRFLEEEEPIVLMQMLEIKNVEFTRLTIPDECHLLIRHDDT